MLFLYNTALGLYGLLLRLAAPFVPKAAAWVAGRRGLLPHIARTIGADPAPRVWFHCASLGEFEQGRPLLEAYRQAHPDTKLVLTFFSPSGYEIRHNWPGADYIFYLPLDTRRNARVFLDIVKPRLIVFVKYEFWYHFLNEAHRRGIPAVVVSAIFRADQVFFQPWGGFFRQILSRFAHIFTQNEASASLLRGLGLTRVSVAGDTRFDTVVATAAAPPRSLPVVEAFVADGAPVLVVGSSWPEDLPALSPLLTHYQSKLRVLMAPHEISETNLRQVEAAFPGQVLRYSQADAATVTQARILLFDNVGLLSQLYRFGQYAYVGGAFGKGLHNTLEAAAFGLPLFFGPTYAKFQEATELVELKCAFPVHNAQELETAFAQLWHNEEARLRLRATMLTYVHSQAGATRTIMAALPHLTAS
ncbi:glycosyltransferase N-terminal domain-containing protein [Hymenobacter sp. BT770]|uniref:3-deoxy-D-manno-octulosonic acid transferase n=1 Tax=Hymenobacter sp. BT770 TaxID=2886942 RepID=UPI001D10A59F|nr:glycosyltransferase N-terminal domain-containing protein [Hymenobacter sp. BT770]MCC3152393.1 3-deoxy-D-manno-octulosonic acid transferase [Hymenobacter sp. BT770]MDO3414631.1 glycosyltransferase N-terminal domain-containing protein [Hymenobacter sp. BT770]